jgi:glycosyltransferase involved in cell wall biosynthesis
MSLGCPVVLSEIEVLKEVYGNAACYVNPFDINHIAAGIGRVLNDYEYKKELIKQGYECAAKYSFEKSALKCIQLINEL